MVLILGLNKEGLCECRITIQTMGLLTVTEILQEKLSMMGGLILALQGHVM